jgi:hypothetical protein
MMKYFQGPKCIVMQNPPSSQPLQLLKTLKDTENATGCKLVKKELLLSSAMTSTAALPKDQND